jgi:tellurite resistance protein
MATLVFGWPDAVFYVVRTVAVAGFVLVAATYLVKAVLFGTAVAGEFRHPIRAAYFPTIPITLVMLAGLFYNTDTRIALALWVTATGIQSLLMLGIFSQWIGNKPYQHSHINAAWHLPILGCLFIPVIGAPLGFLELSWLFLSTGLIFWTILLSLVMNRLVFHGPPAGKALPPLMIMASPPLVAFFGFSQLAPEGEVMLRIFLNTGYAFGFVALMQAPRIVKMRFDLSLWMLTISLSLLTAASLRFSAIADSVIHGKIGIGLFVLLTVIVAMLGLRTILAIVRGEIFRPNM